VSTFSTLVIGHILHGKRNTTFAPGVLWSTSSTPPQYVRFSTTHSSNKSSPGRTAKPNYVDNRKFLNLLIIEHALQELVLHRGLALGGRRNKFRVEVERAKNTATKDIKCYVNQLLRKMFTTRQKVAGILNTSSAKLKKKNIRKKRYSKLFFELSQDSNLNRAFLSSKPCLP